jgi:hypothetical protein
MEHIKRQTGFVGSEKNRPAFPAILPDDRFVFSEHPSPRPAGSIKRNIATATIILTSLLRASAFDPLQGAFEAREALDKTTMIKAEQEGTYTRQNAEWAQFGGVPDVVAWQTPEGRADCMAAKREADQGELAFVELGNELDYAWVGGAAFLLGYSVYRRVRK